MYKEKPVFRLRPLEESLQDIDMAGEIHGESVEKVFIADGDALVMPMDHWIPILEACRDTFPRLRQVSCYAMASNVTEKTAQELDDLKGHGLDLLYIGPESGDELTMRRIAKGPRPAGAAREENYLYDSHVEAAVKAHAAGMKLSTIFLLGAGGVKRTEEHAHASAKLATEMDPEYLSALTLTVVPDSPLDRTRGNLGFELPDVMGLLAELRTFVDEAKPTDAVFRTNHASNYLPLAGRLPADGPAMVEVLDKALHGKIPLRPEWSRGL